MAKDNLRDNYKVVPSNCLNAKMCKFYISVYTWEIFIGIGSSHAGEGRRECSSNLAEFFCMAVLNQDSEAAVPAQESERSSVITSAGKLKPGLGDSQCNWHAQKNS